MCRYAYLEGKAFRHGDIVSANLSTRDRKVTDMMLAMDRKTRLQIYLRKRAALLLEL